MTESIQESTQIERSTCRSDKLFDDEPASLAQLFLQSAEKHHLPNALTYKRYGTWSCISSSDLLERVRNVSAALFSLDVRKGDRAAILASNSPEWTIADAACQFGGVVDVPIYTTLSSASINYILNDSESKVLFLEDEESYQKLKDVLQKTSALRHVVLFQPTKDAPAETISFSSLEQLGAQLLRKDQSLVEKLVSEVRPEDVATLIYTSGTTGEPKGVMLTHSNIISNVIDAAEKYTFSGHDISLSVLPLSHIFERTGMYLYIFFGMMVHYAESIEKVPDNLQEIRPTIFIGVPRIFEKVYAKAKLNAAQKSRTGELIFDWAMAVAKQVALRREHDKSLSLYLFAKHRLADILVYKKLRDFFGGRLRYCITGGAALPDDIFLMFTGAGIPIMQGYGLTETSPVITSNNPADAKAGTVGKPIRNVRVRIAEDGEIEVTGPGVMLGYYNKDDATQASFTMDGWFKTGDIGDLDEDGFLTITDRKKELFKTSGGKYIAPSHIEQMIRASMFVNQAVLIGNERRFPAALIVPNFEQLDSYARLKGLHIGSRSAYCSHPKIIDLIRRQIDSMTSDLAHFEKVKKFVLLENEFTVEGGELTPTLKVKRRVVDEKYRDVIEQIYS